MYADDITDAMHKAIDDQLSAFRLWSDGAFGKSRACRSAVRTITDGTGNHFPVLLPTIDA